MPAFTQILKETLSMTLETLSEHTCFGGKQGFYKHTSTSTGTPMQFAVFMPAQAAAGPVPVLYYLAGLTCTEETATIKAGAQAHAARHGIALVMPDTSPRGANIAGEDDDWDFGSGAGFYLDASAQPWSAHYRMQSYVTEELPALLKPAFALDTSKCGIFGHSMGGHGALTLALKRPDLYRSVSAFAPICAPCHCPWGEKAFSGYLGKERSTWTDHDANALIKSGKRCPPILIDQGTDDGFLAEQLNPELFAATCRDAGQALELRMQPGYDHGYYFISTFMADHLDHHAKALRG